MITRMLILTLAAAFIATVVVAQNEGPAPAARLMKKLNLTDQQQSDVGKLMVDHAKKMVDQKAKLANAIIDLKVLLKAQEPQQSAIDKKIREIADLKVQEQSMRLNMWFAVNKILTPDQQKLWKQALEHPLQFKGKAARPHMNRHMRMRRAPRDRMDGNPQPLPPPRFK